MLHVNQLWVSDDWYKILQKKRLCWKKVWPTLFIYVSMKNVKQLKLLLMGVFIYIKLGIISSPEHEVLMVSYCGQWLSVVRRRVSSVVRQHLMFTL